MMDPCHRFSYKFRSYSAAFYLLMSEILISSRRGQLLPQWTLFNLFHAIIHLVIRRIYHTSFPYLVFTSQFMLLCSFVIVSSGYIVLIALYRHSVRTIFNRKIPTTLIKCMPSFCQHLAMLRPLEIIFRYLTRYYRLLPDVIIVGEVRCGTTTLCHHLSKLDQVRFQGPFCLWAHPEMDSKESFYFVGHYLGYVSPLDYRMCFPLKITKWWHERNWLLRKPRQPTSYVVFDGCAQYLTSPTAAYLIAEAYHQAGKMTLPLLVACVRDPVSQSMSWWRYENNAMLWGQDMGLTEWNTELRAEAYPPTTIVDAFEFSNSRFVERSYIEAESLIGSLIQRGEHTKIRLPAWAITWPAGQLSVFGRNSKYFDNILRYEQVFRSYHNRGIAVHDSKKTKFENKYPCKFEYILIIPTEKLSTELTKFISEIIKRVAHNRQGHERERLFEISRTTRVLNTSIRRNATCAIRKEFRDLDASEIKALHQLLAEDIDEYNRYFNL